MQTGYAISTEMQAVSTETTETRNNFASMGTEQHGSASLSAILLKNYHDPVSMDRLLEQYSRESIRNTMLMHEDIFKQQVHELHRLYRVQKMLMAELRSREVMIQSLTTTTNPGPVTDARIRFGSTSTSEASHSSLVRNKHRSSAHLNFEYSVRCSTTPRSSSQETEDHLRPHKGFDLELPSEEDAPTRAGTSQDQMALLRKHLKKTISMEGSNLLTDIESDVELTLSIGCGSDRKKDKQRLDLNIASGCSEPIPSQTRQLFLSSETGKRRGIQ